MHEGGQTTTEIKATTTPAPTVPPETRIETVAKTTQPPQTTPAPEITETPTTTPAPTTTAPPTTTPAPTTTPPQQKLELKILSTSSYVDMLGYMHVVGEVQNTGETNLNFVQMIATFYDASGKVVGTDMSFTSISILKPNQKSPFQIISLDDSSNVDRYKVQSSSYKITTNEPKGGLEILSHSSNIDLLGSMHVVGEVKNNGDTDSNFVQVVATFYNDAGAVIGTELTFTQPTTIPPGGTSPFELIVMQESSIPQLKDYSLQVEGK